MKVLILNRQEKINIDISLFKRIANYIANKFDKDKNTELNIIFVEKDEIRQLNKKYRNKNTATDVLSFSYNQIVAEKGRKIPEVFNKEHGFSVTGEIIISPEVARDNIRDNIESGFKKGDKTWNFDKELSLLIIHGILHIYDYDHHAREDRIGMENLQNSLLNDVKINFNI